MIRTLIKVVLLCVCIVVAGCGDDDSCGTSRSLVSIQVTPTNPRIANRTSRQFTATGIYSDYTTLDLTLSVAWSSSATNIATINSSGRATASNPGQTTIKATFGAVSGSTTLTVTNATLTSLDIAPIDPSIAKGTTQQFTATGHFSDGTIQDLTTSVTWDSSDPSKATIDPSGKASALAIGQTTITATFGAISQQTTLTVTAATLKSIAVTPINPRISVNPSGTFVQFTATGTFTDNTTQDLTTSVSWSSSIPAFATISNIAGSYGKAAIVASGVTTITATQGTVSGSTTLTVTNALLLSITVTPADPDILVGGTIQFTATGHYDDGSTQNLTSLVTWSSSEPSVATISNAAGDKGLATGVAPVQTTITATSGAIHGSTELEVELD